MIKCGELAMVDVRAVIEITKLAGNKIVEIYNSTQDLGVQHKVDGEGVVSPLTRADTASNEILCNALSKMYPNIPIVSEENKLDDYATRASYEYFFCLDPIDGTKEFIKGNGQFTVNVGLCRGDTPIFGVVDCPALAEGRKTYWGKTEPQPEAYCNEERISVASFSMQDAGLTVVASLSHSSPETSEFISQFKEPLVTSLGSSLKLLMVAEGSAAVYPRLAPTCEWDTCAAHAVVLGAGGSVLQHGPEGLPLMYNKRDPLNPFFVVWGNRK